MGKSFWGSFLAQIVVSLAPLAVVYFLFRRAFGGQTVGSVAGSVIESAKSIPSGVVSLVGAKIRGESESTYITQAEARQMAAEQLAAKRGQI